MCILLYCKTIWVRFYVVVVIKIHAFRNQCMNVANPSSFRQRCCTHCNLLNTHAHSLNPARENVHAICECRTTKHSTLFIIRLEISGLTLVPSGFRVNKFSVCHSKRFSTSLRIVVFYCFMVDLCYNVFSLDFGKLVFQFD